MSAQPVEKDQSDSEETDWDGLSDQTSQVQAPDSIEIKRNAVVSVVIGAAASALAIAYLWRAADTASPLDWLLCLVMTAMAATFLRGLLDARTPLFVADEMGVRIRLGSQWRGIPWEAVDRVVVKPQQGVLHDGRVIITLHHGARAIEGLETRARRHAALNQKMYGGALAVPLGLTTRVTGDSHADLGDRVADLAQGRTQVLTLATGRAGNSTDPVADGGSEEATLVISDESTATADSRPRWMRKFQTVTVTSEGSPIESEAFEDTTSGEEPATAEPAPAEAKSGFGRAVPFKIGQRTTKVDAHVEDGDHQAWQSSAAGGLVIDAFSPVGLNSSKVTSIARLGDPVAPLVIDDFQPEPAYDPVIGPELAAARTRVGLSVDQLAERTRIRPHVIESIEVDDFAPCGGDFYARGHIRTLARVLGKDPEPMLAHFEDRYATAPINARKVFEAELATGMTGSMRRTVGGPNWILLMGVVLVLILVWSMVRLFAGENNELLENPPPVLNGSAGLGNGYEQPAAPVAPPPVVATLTAVNGGTHVEVRDGAGALVYDGDLVLGEVKTVRADPPVTVSADNGGALSVAIQGVDVGFLGDLDQPGTRTFQRPKD